MRFSSRPWLFLLIVLWASAFVPCAGAATLTRPAVLEAFAKRVELVKKQVSEITRSAEAAADRTIANPDMLINVPYGEQPSFAEELVNRAGELSNAFPPEERIKLITTGDVTLIGVRSWEADKAKMIPLIEKWKKNGSRVVVFASKAGTPAKVAPRIDDLIDNGAAGGEAAEAVVNHLTNVLQAHLWVGEYAAALTRRGKYPGVLYSMVMPNSDAHNSKLQASGQARRFLGDTDKPIAPGELPKAYLRRVDQLLEALWSDATLGQVDRAADAVAGQLAAGGKVGIATCTHMLMDEIFLDRKTAMQPFNVVWRAKTAIPENVKEGDMLVWFAYTGLRTVTEDYSTPMRATKAKLVTCFVSEDDPAKNAPEAVAHIEQHWKLPDAEVAVPFPPGAMSPVSGLDVGLIYRMLEEEVAERAGRK